MIEQSVIKVRIFRFDPTKDERPRYETYRVPYFDGMRILDALDYVRDNLGVDVAYRCSCQYRRCGICGVLVNGEPKLACYEPAENEMTIDPLPYFPILRDLVIDRSSYDAKILEMRPFLNRTKPFEIPEKIKPDETLELMTKVDRCLHCLLCVSACPLTEVMLKTFAGPTSFVQLARFAFDHRDGIDRGPIALREGVYDCPTCRKCSEVCPVELAIPETVIEKLRALIVEEGLIKNPLVRKTFTSLHRYGNPWGQPANKRSEWTKTLGVKTFHDNQDLEMLYFVGCTPSYDSRCQEVAKSLATIFKKAGVNFGILGNEERCCGDPMLRLGENGLFENFLEENTRNFEKYGIHKIVTTSPHCYDTFLKHYPANKGAFEVQHYTQYISELIEQDKLRFSKEINGVVTYHDPCFLGRYNKVFEAPRKILAAIPGLSLVEMERTKERSFCCGGGGGRIWTEETPAEERLSVNRAREAASVDASILATACPFCLINLDDAVEVIGKSERIIVKDVAELVKEAM